MQVQLPSVQINSTDTTQAIKQNVGLSQGAKNGQVAETSVHAVAHNRLTLQQSTPKDSKQIKGVYLTPEDKMEIVEAYTETLSQLSKLQHPLNSEQQSTVRSFVTSLQNFVTTSSDVAAGQIFGLRFYGSTLYCLPYDLITQLFKIDEECALDLIKTCIAIPDSRMGILGLRNRIVNQIVNNEEIEFALCQNFNNKYKNYLDAKGEDCLTTKDCQTIVNYLHNRDVRMLGPQHIIMVDILVGFIRHEIESCGPLCETDDFSILLENAFTELSHLEHHTWIHRLRDSRTLLIAITCLNVPTNASDKLKKLCSKIVAEVQSVNGKFDSVLDSLFNSEITASSQENVKKHLSAFLIYQSGRIQASSKNITQQQIDKIQKRSYREETFSIESAPRLKAFLQTHATGNKNEIFQNCLLEAFKVAIKDELNLFHQSDSQLLELSVEYLMKIKNYQLAHSLSEIYFKSNPTNIDKFKETTYKNLMLLLQDQNEANALISSNIEESPIDSREETSVLEDNVEDLKPKAEQVIQEKAVEKLSDEPNNS